MNTTRADEPRNDESLPCKLDHLDKAWNLKCKSVAVKETLDHRAVPQQNVSITLEFTKDATDVKAIRTAFHAVGDLPAPKDGPTRVLCYFFDEDNVAISKKPVMKTEGEITCKMGDAFRVVFRAPIDLEKVKRLELRPSETE
jgi:hypothetical protein